MECQICGNTTNNQKFMVREMMYGLPEEFPYMECSHCGFLQIIEIPSDLGRYYPSDYHSFGNIQSHNFIKEFLGRKRNHYAVFKEGFWGMILNKFIPHPFFTLMGSFNLTKDSPIMDVGCGSGILLGSLNEIGFKNLTGVDPHLPEESINQPIRIIKKDLTQYSGVENAKQEKNMNDSPGFFDLIIFSHSLEHMENQKAILDKVFQLLNPGGYCMVRMPLKSNYIWERYGVNWVQIDAPRHLYLHTHKSFSLLVNKTDLEIERVIYDSWSFQFWGSEQNKNGIPLEAENSYSVNKDKSIFSPQQIKKFEKKAHILNNEYQGDQGTFIMRRPP